METLLDHVDVERTLEQPAALAHVRRQEMAVTPMTLIERAVAAAASIEQVEKLIALQERWEANEAKKAFAEAFGRFKAESVTVIKNVTIKDGPLKGKKHADLFGVCDAVIPALSKHGLSHSWRLTKDEPGWMEITCIIRHNLGYSESVSMGGAPDSGPGRNAIQSRGSAKTYLERYTLLAATGLAATEEDKDGSSPSPEGQRMTEEEFLSRLDAIAGAADNAQLQDFYLKSLKASRDLGDKSAEDDLVKAKNKRYRELNGTVRNASR